MPVDTTLSEIHYSKSYNQNVTLFLLARNHNLYPLLDYSFSHYELGYNSRDWLTIHREICKTCYCHFGGQANLSIGVKINI